MSGDSKWAFHALPPPFLHANQDYSTICPSPVYPVFLYANTHLPKDVSDFESVLWESLPKFWTLYADEKADLPPYGTVDATLSLLYRNGALEWDPHQGPLLQH